MSNENTIPWTVEEIGPHLLHNHLVRALREIIKGDPESFLPDSHIPNGTVKHYLEQAVLFGNESCLDALVANLRNAVFNFENMPKDKA